MKTQPFFAKRGDAFIPNPPSGGPWNPNSMHGRVVIGLLAHVIEERHGSADFVPVRLTVDMFRLPDILTPVEVTSDVTLYLHRLPVTRWIGFEVVNHHASEGVAIGECWLYDEKGPIGTSTVAALAQRKPMTSVKAPSTPYPSLRAKRSNPSCLEERMDCFVASLLAMTRGKT